MYRAAIPGSAIDSPGPAPVHAAVGRIVVWTILLLSGPVLAAPPVVLPASIRVGLATDIESFELPCCREQWVLRVDGIASGLRVPSQGVLEIKPSPGIVDEAVYRLQVAALKDETQAHQLADRLSRTTGEESDVVFDAAIDLYRVRVGRHSSRAEAERAGRRLEALEIEGSWIVAEGGELIDPAFELIQGERRRRLDGRWLLVRGSSDSFVFGGHRYRGSLLLFLNSRGKLNVVNRLPLDDYLRGVLPREMGPELYPSVEALKALAVAARSYVLRNLGEFEEEGYDICATPRCQVYGGMDAEHPKTDRAILETADQLLIWQDEPADALYSASCGGHTENVEVVFPLKNEPYLRGVACLERGPETLVGRGAPKPDLEGFLVASVLPERASSGAAGLESELRMLASRSGRPRLDGRLDSLSRSAVRAFVSDLFGLDLRELGSQDLAPGSGQYAERELTHFFDRSPAQIGESERSTLLLLVSLHTGLIERVPAHFLRLTDGGIKLRIESRHEELRLSPDFVTMRQGSDGERAQSLTLWAGDPLVVYRNAREAVAILASLPHGTPVTSRNSWSRFRTDTQLARMVAERYPGFHMQSLEVKRRGDSGRVALIELTTAEGSKVEIEGLAIRWTLDLPETLFTVERQTRSGRRGWMFRGYGHGHGVGLCQQGAHAMAQAGHDYRGILNHFYSGLEIRYVQPQALAASAPTRSPVVESHDVER